MQVNTQSQEVPTLDQLPGQYYQLIKDGADGFLEPNKWFTSKLAECPFEYKDCKLFDENDVLYDQTKMGVEV